MDITPFIRELLFGHDCVILPGFGGFLGNYTPARIDKTSFTFYPPVKQISFNRNLNHNDGLLVGRISESLKVNYGDARNIIDEFVLSLRKKLEKGETMVFDNIGSFNVNHEGKNQFEPETGVNYHLDSYGLDSFQFQPLEGYDVRKRITPHTSREPIRNASVRKILWRAAVIIPLLGLLVVVPLKTDLLKSKVESSTLNPLATAEFENNRKAVDENKLMEPANPDANAVINTGTPAKEEITESPALSVPVPAFSNGAFCLITGSFKSRENAENQLKVLEKDGFIPEIINAPNGFFRVSAMRCGDLDTAIGQKESITGKYPGTWIKKI
jgi:nucleoid DNA-binding protein